MSLNDKVKQSIKLLKTIQVETIELAYSGGKDSDVILRLAQLAGIPYRAIYKDTSIDPPLTHKHVRENGVEIFNPKIRFFDIVKKSGFPTRRARICCKELKEYKVLDDAIHGIRRSESVGRSLRYQEPIVCRTYGSKANHVNVVLPILDWTDQDIEEFIKSENIKCHPLYYDEDGSFHVERRLGCMACPLKSDQIRDFERMPRLVKLWLRSGKIWLDTHPNASCHKKFGSVYDLFFQNVFCDTYGEYLKRKQLDLWGGELDCKKYLEDYFKIDLSL